MNGNFEKFQVYFIAVSAIVPKWPYMVIFIDLTKHIVTKVDLRFSWYANSWNAEALLNR